MKFCRFEIRNSISATASSPRYGIIEGDRVVAISGMPWGQWSRGTETLPLAEVRLLAPVEPSKIVCLGRNYAAHAKELGNEVPKEPLLFLKPPSSIAGPDDPIVLTKYSKHVEHECELVLVIGKKCSQLSDAEDPLSYVMGYTCLNDVSARDLQKSDGQWIRAKGFDSFCPIGPHIETELDPCNVLIETRVNEVVRQSANTSLMIFSPPFLVRWISRMMTLLPGDIIATGTPAGVAPIVPGDIVEVSVAGIGVLRNPVQAPKP
jgi:2-keto-4-pentenoate hydratase/2-oxohepta-3-ene-1,7-dioic acid hydratase in catechol pathway